MIPAPQIQRMTAWLCLVALTLISTLPVGGISVCLGHDGHLAIEAAVESDGCPCGHDAVTTKQDPAPDPGDTHAPCKDLLLVRPDVLWDGAPAQQQMDVLCDSIADALQRVLPACLQPQDLQPEPKDLGQVPWLSSAEPVPRPQLDHLRAIVLQV